MTAPPPLLAPPVVRIEVVGAFVAPMKAGGRPWDGFMPVSANVQSELLHALQLPDRNAMIAAFGVLAVHVAHDGLAAPEPRGWTQIDRGGGYGEPRELPLRFKDSYVGQWAPGAWRRVVLTDRVLVRVELVDDDLKNDDPIGVAVLTSRELLDAARARGAPVSFPVAEQTNKQLLSVTVAVSPE